MKKTKRRRPAKRPHDCLSNGLCVHGAFKTRAAADRKAGRVRGSFVVKKFARWGRGPMSTRYVVFTRDAGTEFNF